MSYEELLENLAQQDERLVVMTAENRAAIRNLPSKLGNRFVDVGICEQTMIGAAAGLALRGRRPITHALATFITLRAFEFIRTDVGIGNLPVIMVGGVPGFLSDANGPTHQAVEDVSLMRGIPNVNVFCPADAEELTAGMQAIIGTDEPWYVRHIAAPARVEHSPFQIGRAEQLRSGDDLTILTYGFMLGESLRAADLLAEQGTAARVLNLRTLKPIDEDAIMKAAAETGLLVTVEDHFMTGGLYSILSELLVRYETSARVLPIALENRWFKPALLPDVLRHEGFTGEQIAERIRTKLNG